MKNTRIARIKNGVQPLFWLLCCSLSSIALAQQDEFPRIIVTNGDGDTQVICIQDVPANLSVLDGEVVLTASALQDDFGCPEPNAVIIGAGTFVVSEDLPGGNANGDGIAQANEDLIFEANLIGAGLDATDISCDVTGPVNAFPAGTFPINAIIAADPFGGPGDFLLQARATVAAVPPTINDAVFTLNCTPASSTNGMSSDTTTIDIMGADPDRVAILSFGASASAVNPGDVVTFSYTLDFLPSTITDATCQISAPPGVFITDPVVISNPNDGANSTSVSISSASPIIDNAVITLTCSTGGNSESDTVFLDIETEDAISCTGTQINLPRDQSDLTFIEEFGVPWPTNSGGGITQINVNTNQFLGLAFDGTQNTTFTSGIFEWAEASASNVGQGSAIVSLSPCLGQFQNLIDPDCVASGLSSSILWGYGPMDFSGNSDSVCFFPQAQPMFLNIVFGNDTSPTTTTCDSPASCSMDVSPVR